MVCIKTETKQNWLLKNKKRKTDPNGKRGNFLAKLDYHLDWVN